MAYSNTTPNYDLPQYVGTDIPNPLTDFNGAMSTIDSTMKNIADGVGASDADIAALEVQNGSEQLTTTAQTLSGAVNELDADINGSNGIDSRLTTVETNQTADESTLSTAVANLSTVTGKVSALETQNGSAVLTTTAQTLSGAVNELDDDINNASTGLVKKVDDLEAQNGNSVLTTTAQTLSGAVNELKSAVDAIPTATVDTAMSSSSTNAVQNKVIKEYVDDTVATGVGETQSGTLTAGNTTIALTFSDVTIGATTRLKFYTSEFGVNPTAVAIAGQVVTLTFDAQASDITVAVTAVN